jgi:hypothetical protein
MGLLRSIVMARAMMILFQLGGEGISLPLEQVFDSTL